MMPSYCYSLDRSTWTGSYPSREEAREAAVVKAKSRQDSPPEVFVALRIEPDAQTALHARDTIDRMRRRFQESSGGSSKFLARVTERQEADLDAALEATINDWLKTNDLVPTEFKVKAIGEYPVPAARPVPKTARGSEVHEIGQTSDGE